MNTMVKKEHFEQMLSMMFFNYCFYPTELLRQVLSSMDLNLSWELHLLLEHTNSTLGDLRPLIMGERHTFF